MDKKKHKKNIEELSKAIKRKRTELERLVGEQDRLVQMDEEEVIRR